ncbi:golgin subfamily B member 1-like isoform X3 [Corythoichthys intestinalis]|uniref:golgin subfamily B member 1-like isoform X3 n=1 Tax=Corythoichthys intestinalis TaxID=161448 RepID=UPI0025A537BD|nr:golgin subfamily B member 1-like isoform X3 [Corythoichthys intestinalis]
MLKWFSNEEGESGSGVPGSPQGGSRRGGVEDVEIADRLVQTEQLVTQLKELIREKDATLSMKNEELKMEKEACESKLSKLRLQNKAKVTSLTTQLEELKKQTSGQDTPTHSRKGPSEGGEQATRGKIVLLKKKIEELEQHLAKSEKDIENKRTEVEALRLRGEEMDVMLTEKDRKLAEKEGYIIHLQTALVGDQSITSTQQKGHQDHGAMQELQQLVQSLTKKVGEEEERYSLLQEQTDSLKELLDTEKDQYSQKESMYKQNIQTFKEIILQKDSQLTEINQRHEQELFKLAAKSDASADLEQLLKALKQKLHEKEEVLLGKTQVIDVLQKEVDGRDQQIKELTERMRRLHIERESIESKMEAEKHVMRAQLRDLMEKQQVEVQRMSEKHQAQLTLTQQDLLAQLDELRRNSVAPQSVSQEPLKPENASGYSASLQRIVELEAQAKQKIDEASRSEAKFLKMKAWSKSRIRQLEDELKRSQAGIVAPDMIALRSRITELEVELEEHLWKVEQYDELKANNDMLEAKLVVYEEQQRTLQADLEQFTKRAASQASETGSADDPNNQVLEWQEMVDEAVSARDQAREEKAAMALRISHMEEEREALATRQQELEEELAQAQGLRQHRAKKQAVTVQRSLQEDFEFDGKAPFQDYQSTSESTTPMEGENMGGWWPEYSTPGTDGLRTVVEELELERNQLQEQILSLEERCGDLEDRLQLQARIETLQVTFDVDEDEQPQRVSQNESDKLQTQLASVRSQQSRETEKHQLLVSSLNEQLKGLSDTQECLESSLIEKENTLAKTSEKLELINGLKESLSEKEIQVKEMSDKLLQTEQALENVSKKSKASEKHISELKAEVLDLTQKLSGLRDKTQKQDDLIGTLQNELDQTNEELDKLNISHLEERAQLIHDLQSCEREIDNLKDILSEKDKALNANMLEYTEQVTVLKQELRIKEENLIQVENALTKADREARIIRDSQTADQQALNDKIAELVGNMKDIEMELDKTKEEIKSKVAEKDNLIEQAKEDKKTIQDLQEESRKQVASLGTQLSEYEGHISSLREQLTVYTQRQKESDELIFQLKEINSNNEKITFDKAETYEKELKTLKEEKNKLLSEVEKYNHDMELLSKELKEQAQSKDNVQKEKEKSMEIIASLENQLKANEKQAADEKQSYSAELQIAASENQKLSKELNDKIESISKMKDLLNHMESEKKQLQGKLVEITENLELQNLNGKQLSENVASSLELNNSLKREIENLTQENKILEMEVTERVKTISELKAERDSLHAKLSILESQLSQNNRIIQELEKTKEDLILQTNSLKATLEQTIISHDEVVLAKTNECSNRNQLLGEKDNLITQLQGQLQGYISKIDELHLVINEKQKIICDLKAELEIQNCEQVQLKETLSLFQEQDCSLKSGLLEKDTVLREKQQECQSLQSEIIFHKNSVSTLEEEVETLSSKHSQLSRALEEREIEINNMAQQCQLHKDNLDDVNVTVKALKNEINEMEEKSKKLKSEADSKETELRTLERELHRMTEENQQLQTVLKSQENELAKKIQTVSELDRELKVILEQNSSLSMKITCLTDENGQLQKDLAQNISLASELKIEMNLLKVQKSEFEEQLSNDKKIINELLDVKNELTDSLSNAKTVLHEKEMSNEQIFREKTNEYSILSKTLNERGEHIQKLQEKINDLNNQIKELNHALAEKEEILLEKNSLIDAQQMEQLQLQDTISMLQEQECVLKKGLLEKDAVVQQRSVECIGHQKEITLQKDLVSQMQCEVESSRCEYLTTKQQLEEKEHILKDITSVCEHQKEELKERSESMIKLESQILAMKESLVEMEIKMTNSKGSIEMLSLENSQLIQGKEQMKAAVIDLKDAIQALNNENSRLKSDLEKSFAELSGVQEEVAHLKTAFNDGKLQLKTAQSETEHLNVTIQRKDDSLKQLGTRVSEQEEQIKEKDHEMFSLRVQVTELGDSVCKLKDQVQSLTSESSALKNILERKEQSSLENQRNISLVNENLTVNLQDKERECEMLKEQISHLEEYTYKISNTLQIQSVESINLKKELEERENSQMEQSQSLQDLQRTADELLLFKTRFMESNELVTKLQSQMQMLSADAANHKKSAEEIQSAFINLQEKYASNLEDLQDMRRQLSQRTDEVLTLKSSTDEHETAKTTIETLRGDLSSIRDQLEKTQTLNSKLSKEKDEAFASHQASVSLWKIEIERLKADHLQAVAQMNALTENLEQREMALHAINNQYTAQAKHTSHLIAEIQKLELQNKKLSEEMRLSNIEHQRSLTAANNENVRLAEDIRKGLAEKEELERRHHQIWEVQKELKVQLEQQSSSMSESIQQMAYDKESLQIKVSAKDEEISRLKENIHKVEEILQDTEKEWLLVLDKEKQDKKLILEQLSKVEDEIASKDVKVNALKQDLESLQAKLSEAFSAIERGSNLLSAKEFEASSSRLQLEKVLALVKEKDNEKNSLQQALKAAEQELKQLVAKISGADAIVLPVTSNEDNSHFHRMIKQIETSHCFEVDDLKNKYHVTLSDIQQMQKAIDSEKMSNYEKSKEITFLQDRIETLQTQLKSETEKGTSFTSLHSEIKTKDELISSMTIQISQQKELVFGLSQQLKEKDASIAHVMESALNERVKLGDENTSLSKKVTSLQHDYHACTKKYEEISLQLEECNSSSLRENEIKASEKLELVKENNDLKCEIARINNEKCLVKKKLQASLLIRKDLLKKIEEFEKINDSRSDNESISGLQEKVVEATTQANFYEEKFSFLEKECLDKVKEIHDRKMQTEKLAEQLQLAIGEKEICLQQLGEKSVIIQQLQTSFAEQKDIFEQDKKRMMENLEELQHKIKESEGQFEDGSFSNGNTDELEKELAQVKQEKAILQKKTKTALLARKETLKKAEENENHLTKELIELKGDYKALLEQHGQQTNELIAVQLNYNDQQEEMVTLRRLVQEKDDILQELKVSLAESERRCYSPSKLRTQSENPDEAFTLMEEKPKEILASDFQKAESELEKPTSSNLQNVKFDFASTSSVEKDQTEMIEKYREKFKMVEVMLQQETQDNTLLDQMLTIQKVLAETQQRLCEKEYSLTEMLNTSKLDYIGNTTNVAIIRQDDANALRIIDELRTELVKLNTQLNQCKHLMELIFQKIPERSIKQEHANEDAMSFANSSAIQIEATVKHKNDESEITEKDELIAALQLQLQQVSANHESSIIRMKKEIDCLNKSQEICGKDQDNQNKIMLLTKKLQAALVSRKELMTENASLKEECGTLSAKISAKETECLALETSFSGLKQLNLDLEINVKQLYMDKSKLSSEVDRILNDNCNLSDACESLKQTIENITQQKQAFSCQLESLKDSQAEELTKWKSRHSELKQDYETLLQAYENVSTEMDKMRHHLKGARRDRQEALRKIHRYETEMESLQGQARQMEDEHESLKEKMQTFSEDKLRTIVDQQQTTENINQVDINEAHKMAICELTNKSQHIEAKELQQKSLSEACKDETTNMQVENGELTENLQASHSSEEMCIESKSYINSMQLKEALNLNNSLTAQIEAQKSEFSAQIESNNILKEVNANLSERIDTMQSGYELQLRMKDDAINELKDILNKHSQEVISLNEKVKILEDDKCLLQEELENVQGISDKVKNENEYLERVILENSQTIDELSESISNLQAQNRQLSTRLETTKEINNTISQEKEDQQLKLVRDFEAKLKYMQRGKEGSKNNYKELQELLKEKHQEINHLQQNCIKYQERILNLESSLKTSEFSCENLKKDLSQYSDKISVAEEKYKQVEANLITYETRIQEATERIEELESERDHLKLSAANIKSENALKEESKLKEATVEKQFNSLEDNEAILLKEIDELTNLNYDEIQKVTELKQQVNSQNFELNTLKQALEINEAKLSALSSTPQGENSAKLWNDLYQKALQEKDKHLMEQGFAIKKLMDNMLMNEKEVTELRTTKSRLERTLNRNSNAFAAHQKQLFVLSASNTELSETVKRLTVQVNKLSAQVKIVEKDKNTHEIQIADKEDKISQLNHRLNLAEKINADLDAEFLLLQSQNDKVQAEFENQKGISLQLKTLLQNKDAEISSLLSCSGGQMSGYLEQLQINCHFQETVYEDRLISLQYQREMAAKESRELEAKVRNLQNSLNMSVQEKEQVAARMEIAKNSMVSLQIEKEQLMSEYRILKEKSNLELKPKEALPDNEGEATRGPTHDISKLLHQMDDLNSENAMLRAQLVRYREDLTQVLSLKDNQSKVLLKKQEDVIKNLENQKTTAINQHIEALSELQKEFEINRCLKEDISKLTEQIAVLQVEIVSQNATNEGKVIADLQQAVAAKSTECSDLQQELLSQQTQIDDLKKQMELIETETEKKLASDDDKYKTELAAYEHEVDLMRADRQSIEQSVTELTKDLRDREQQLLETQGQDKDNKAQNESLCKAMVALQNDRDQLIEDFKILRNRGDEELRVTRASLNKIERSFQNASSDVAMLTKEREILVCELRALESKDTHMELKKLLVELAKALTEKEKQLKNAEMENCTYSKQLSAFSKSMASLQNDRDRLADELEGVTRVVESRQGSGLNTVRTMSEKNTKGSAFQIEKHGVMNELQPRLIPEKDAGSLPKETAIQRSETNLQPFKETVHLLSQSEMEGAVSRLEAERMQLNRELQRCLCDIQQRDQYFQQLNLKLQQAIEEKAAVATQLSAVSQTLRDTQNRCHWLESQSQAQGSVTAEVAPGAPQERHSTNVAQTVEVHQLRERLLELEQNLAEEQQRRETAEAAFHLAEASTKSISSSLSQDIQRDFSSIEMETDAEWEAMSLNPNQPLITRKVKGGMVACRRWFRGRSLYFSRLLTTRSRSRYLFLAYMVTIHVLFLMCLTGAF